MRHFRSVQTIRADQALTREGWREDVRITIGDDGRIAAVETGMASGRHEPDGIRVGILLPSPVNLHSHSFQRAMSGLSERRGPSGRDSFWTWRETMYRFVDVLTPDDAQAIAAFVQMEMLEAGYAGVAEFHYLHHQPDGAPYADIAEMSARIASAAAATGIGLTLLPVLYEQGGCDGRPLGAGEPLQNAALDGSGKVLEVLTSSGIQAKFGVQFVRDLQILNGIVLGPGPVFLGGLYLGQPILSTSRFRLTRSREDAKKGKYRAAGSEFQPGVRRFFFAFSRLRVQIVND